MATILHIDASVRSDRSLSRKLSKAFQPQEQLTDDKRRILAVSDELIEELRLA